MQLRTVYIIVALLQIALASKIDYTDDADSHAPQNAASNAASNAAHQAGRTEDGYKAPERRVGSIQLAMQLSEEQ
ncbi:hypothetical protein PpBr36_09124 [Pyricularia pennisetigena]|uniref:hypothetical protein n=1 Tax=Pyricularia pennisetigena TaxID=1578925 RepID=UPI0011512BF3|nr:hypothetical protein PpBr36_09124 [Pyricularia pennisetigena]TLS24097.1 hypothetical protein PpBr36_09124 [Pyricularia pennisetigena]